MRSTKSILSAAVFAAMSAAAVFAQDDTVRVETNLVTANVSVTDRSGNFVRGLKREDFAIVDSGRLRDVDTVFGEDAPLSIGIVYDMHPTTGEHTADVLRTLKKLTSELRPQDDFFVSVFNERGTLTTEFVPDNDQLQRHLSDARPNGPSSLYDAIFDAGGKFGRLRNSKRILLVLTDGADHSSDHSIKELKARLRSVNLPLYALTFNTADRRQYGYLDIMANGPRRSLGGQSTEIDRAAIASIAKTTGGQAFESSIRNQYYLGALINKVLDEVRNQYVIGFYPDEPDGRWHSLKITVKGQKAKRLKVSGRTGYLSRKN